jgi:hypothetical protein
MKLRHLLVAASAVAVLAGTSVGASAGSWNFSKGESSSGVVSVGTFDWFGKPIAKTIQGEHTSSVAIGGWSGAGAFAGTSGGSTAGATTWNNSTQTGYTAGSSTNATVLTSTQSGASIGATAGGSTFGGSCAGSGCGH